MRVNPHEPLTEHYLHWQMNYIDVCGKVIPSLRRAATTGYTGCIGTKWSSPSRLHVPLQCQSKVSLAYLMIVISTIANALGQSVVSRLSRMHSEGNSKQFASTMYNLLAFGVLTLVLGVPISLLIGRPLLSLIYRPEYGAHVMLFVILVGAAGVSAIGTYLNYGMVAVRAFKIQIPIVGVTTLIISMSSLLLINRIGMFGIAYSLLAGAAFQVTGSALVLIYRTRS